jgi:hypothetical protein
MITDTKNILAIAAAIQPGEVLYKEVINETVAKRCASRVTCHCRYGKKMASMQFSCRIVLAVETANKTQLLLRIERIA